MKNKLSGILVISVFVAGCASMTGRDVVMPEGMKRPTTVAEGLQILVDLKHENEEQAKEIAELRRIIAEKENCKVLVPKEGE